MDMASGKLLRLPEEGAALDQDMVLIANLSYAWRAWYIHGVKTAEQHSQDDIEWSRENIEDVGKLPA